VKDGERVRIGVGGRVAGGRGEKGGVRNDVGGVRWLKGDG